MKFGVRECCDVVFRAKAPMKVGKKIFYKGEPVIYFDSLKTSTLEGAATTVYAQGGRGNARLMSWDGERTVTFTMEDALISPEGLAILTGAGLLEAGSNDHKIYVHCTEKIEVNESYSFTLEKAAYTGTNSATYVMILDSDDNMMCEPFSSVSEANAVSVDGATVSVAKDDVIAAVGGEEKAKMVAKVLIDYYHEMTSGAMEINITPDKFGGAFYIEASTLFREYPSQLDLPAEFIIPNGRVQSNFTFTMAGSGDPSTFTFTVDAFPDYTRFNQTEKVLASIQVIGGGAADEDKTRDATNTKRIERDGLIVDNTDPADPEPASYDGGDMDA
jgi:hypothetical protein